jgi:hypothetical protein
VGALVGLATYGVVSAGAFAITQRTDTDASLPNLERNRYILSGIGGLAGIALAMKGHPLIGVGLAAGALGAVFGAPLAIAIGNVVDKKPSATTVKGLQQQMAAVYAQNMGAVYAQSLSGTRSRTMRALMPAGMGAVYAQNLGDFAPSAPWMQQTPFGY